MNLAHKALQKLLDIEGAADSSVVGYVRENAYKISHPVAYATYKYMWADQNYKQEALDSMKDFTARLSDDLAMRTRAAANPMMAQNGLNGMSNGTSTCSTP